MAIKRKVPGWYKSPAREAKRDLFEFMQQERCLVGTLLLHVQQNVTYTWMNTARTVLRIVAALYILNFIISAVRESLYDFKQTAWNCTYIK